MKIATIALLTLVLALAAGCSSTPYVDREIGRATQTSFERQIAYPDYRYAHKTPEGMDGVTAENVMNIYHKTFAEKPQKNNVLDFQFVPGGMGGQ